MRFSAWQPSTLVFAAKSASDCEKSEQLCRRRENSVSQKHDSTDSDRRARPRARARARTIGSAHMLSALRLVAPEGRSLVLRVRSFVEHVRYWRSLPSVPAPMDWDSVSLLFKVVGSFELVCGIDSQRHALGTE